MCDSSKKECKMNQENANIVTFDDKYKRKKERKKNKKRILWCGVKETGR